MNQQKKVQRKRRGWKA